MRHVWAWGTIGLGAVLALFGARRAIAPSTSTGWITWRVPTAGRYRVTDDDRLWLLRSVEREGDRERTAQTLVNGFASRKAYGQAGTLEGFVRAYSQPVNPRWFPGGDLFQAELARHPVEDRPELVAAAEQRERVHSRRTSFSQATEEAVRRALEEGPVDIPKAATDFADWKLDASRRLTQLTASTKGQNTLWTNRPSWPGYGVA